MITQEVVDKFCDIFFEEWDVSIRRPWIGYRVTAPSNMPPHP